MKRKTIHFEFYQVYLHTDRRNQGDTAAVIFDLSGYLNQVVHLTPAHRTLQYFEDQARLEICSLIIDQNYPQPYWELLFVRRRLNERPGISIDAGGYDLMDLPPGQTLAEFTTALYDPTLRVLCLQRNKHALGKPGIERFFERSYQQPGQEIELRPLLHPDRIGDLQNANIIRSIDVSFANVNSVDLRGTSATSPLATAVRSGRTAGSVTMSVSYSMGHTRSNMSMDRATTINDLAMLQHNIESNAVSSAKIKYKLTPEQRASVLDLVKDKMVIPSIFEYENPAELTPRLIFQRLRDQYFDARLSIERRYAPR